jgi:hypothetical protein
MYAKFDRVPLEVVGTGVVLEQLGLTVRGQLYSL